VLGPATARRIAESEATFRAANEEIEDAAENLGEKGEIPFICECGDPSCTELVRVELTEYERIRSSPVSFFVVPGHEDVAGSYGRVTEDRDPYLILEKLDEAAEVARELDPRS
jgi:hypothetical protein